MPHYFDEAPGVPSAERSFVLDVDGTRLALRTDRNVFSHGRLDAGTALLLRAAPHPPATGTFLDLGCGVGPIALALARRSPDASVWAVDVNERARALCAANAAANRLENVTVGAPDDVPGDVRLDLIWSNPPIRIGKPALHVLLTTWIGRLAADGRAVLVVHKHLGSDSLHRWLEESGWPTRRLTSAHGYRVLEVTAGDRSLARRVDGDPDS
ncbi:MAG: methyltransferase [Ilumatobacteraceae bacterium]